MDDFLIINTDKLPQGVEIITTFSIVQLVTSIIMAEDELQTDLPFQLDEKIIQNFKDIAPTGTNAIINLSLSTNIQKINDNEYIMFFVYIGTPVILS